MLQLPDTLKRRRRLRTALGAIAALAALIVFAPGANAASYNVPACNSAGGVNHSWGQWWNSGISTIASNDTLCSGNYYDGNTNRGMFARYVANSTDPQNAAGGWSMSVGGGNNINAIMLSDWFTRNTTNDAYAFLASNYGLLEGCFNGTSVCGAVYGDHTLGVGGATSLRTEVGCVNRPCLDTSGIGTAGIFAMYDVVVNVNDLTTPTNSASGSLWTSAWQRGVQAVTVAANDTGDGIQKNALVVDGSTVASQAHGCDYTYTRPCGDQTDGFTYNTSSLSDGAHTAQVVSWDGAQDSPLTISKTMTIHVDNNAPTRDSGVSVAGGDGWHTSNSFGVSWTNPSQGNGAPIVAAHYSLCLASNPTNCPVTDARVVGAGISSLSGITVPARGDYLLRVWDEDAAGNVNSATASDPVHLMFDDQAPGLAQPAHANGWINAQDAKSYPELIDLTPFAKTKVPVSGIKGYSITLDGSKPDSTVEASGETLTYRLGQLPEGHNLLSARAISNAGVPAADSDLGTAELDVDKTAPTVAESGAPSPAQWQPQAVTLQLTGTDQPGLSGMGAAAPDQDVTQGAYIAYRIDGGPVQRVRGAQAPVTVASDGQHTLTYQAYDVAGNPSSEQSVSFRVDRTPPELVTFAARDAQDPRALNVVASDRTSGVAGGTVQIRKVGSSTWTSLPTTNTADGHYAARLDDSQLDRSAMYEARAVVSDNAANQATGSAYSNGAPVAFSGSLREQTKVRATFSSTACVAKKKAAKHKGKKYPKRAAAVAKKKPTHKKKAAACAKAKRPAQRHTKKHAKRAAVAVIAKRKVTHKKKAAPKKKVASTANKLVPFGKRARIQGTLTTAGGAPIANADLVVDSTLAMAGAVPHREAVVRTDSQGHFAYDAPAGASRRLAFDYEGSNELLPGSGSVTLRVPASASFRSKPHVVKLHQRLTFSGKLRTMGAPLPKVGKLVYLQAFDRGKWRKFAVLRTRKGGSFSYRFSFEAAGSRGVTYRIKAVVPREAGYAFDNGESKQIKVRVKG
jgi:hypothetical protein